MGTKLLLSNRARILLWRYESSLGLKTLFPAGGQRNKNTACFPEQRQKNLKEFKKMKGCVHLALTWVEYAASLYIEDSLQEKQAEKSKAVVHHCKPFHPACPVGPN